MKGINSDPKHSSGSGNTIEHSTRRTRTSYPGATYILPSDIIEKQRLELQHNLYKVAFGGKLILAPVAFESGDRILDCGAGTGIWLLQLAETLSNDVHLQGIDIENRLFPQDTRHSNLNFCIHSTLTLPNEWKTTFKFIHQRLFVTALKKEQWAFELRELYNMLLPGGWVQLCEPGTRHAGEVTERVRHMITSLYASRDIFEDIWQHMPSLLKEAGFINVVTEERKTPLGRWAGQHGEQVRDNYVSLFRAMKSPVLDAGGFGVVNSEGEFDDLLTMFGDELDGTPGAYVRWFVFYAQKPQ